MDRDDNFKHPWKSDTHLRILQWQQAVSVQVNSPYLFQLREKAVHGFITQLANLKHGDSMTLQSLHKSSDN